MKPGMPPPFAVALKRKWLREAQVLYKDAHYKVAVQNSDDENRISVGGDLSSHSLNVTISELRATDTDRYYCEFVVESESSEDKREPGTTEFFLLVTPGEYFIFSSHTLLNFFARPHEVGLSLWNYWTPPQKQEDKKQLHMYAAVWHTEGVCGVGVSWTLELPPPSCFLNGLVGACC